VVTRLSFCGIGEATWSVPGVQAAVAKALARCFGVAASRIRLVNPAFNTSRRLATATTSSGPDSSVRRLARRLETSVTCDAVVSVPPAEAAAAVLLRVRSATSGAGLAALTAAANHELASDVSAGLIPTPIPSVELAVTVQAALATPPAPRDPAPAASVPYSSQLSAAMIAGLLAAGLMAGTCLLLRKNWHSRSEGSELTAAAGLPKPRVGGSNHKDKDGVPAVGTIRVVAFEAKAAPSRWDPRTSPRVQDSAMVVPVPKNWCDEGPTTNTNPVLGPGPKQAHTRPGTRPNAIAVAKMRTRDV
jgi:hypothetical protein